MPNFTVRSDEQELMDDFNVKDQGLLRTLRELEIINLWLGGNNITFSGLETLLKQAGQQPVTVVDLGCGSGDMVRQLAKRFKKNHPQIKLIGVDANPAVIEYAKSKSVDFPDIEFITDDIFSERFQKREFDIILCTLFTHHFEDNTLLQLLKHWRSQAKIGVVINDLHRHWFAYHSIDWLTRLFSKSYMTKYDAKLSVLRSFKKNELENLTQKAGWMQFSLKWKWAFRWQLILSHH
ncbi:methyltransferase domain-containing protein [Limibacter armeniacum]|uniref:methyltransferase domain-containing protein n=1 Tax=Limibacter armeniacum TaxID=466084 RepID=UPI002FE57035